MERKQITFYLSFYRAIRRIKKKADRCDAYDALFDYAFSGIEPDMDKLPDAAAIAFVLVKPNIDASNKKAVNGSKGGSTSKVEEKPESNYNQDRSKPEANWKQTTSKKENKKENKIEIEDECLMIGPETPSVISLPLNDGSEFGVTVAMASEFSTLYPAVDVMQELRNMRGWLLNNPKNRKTASGIRRFINSWLAREQDKPRTQPKQQNTGYVHGADRLLNMLERGDFDD